MAHTDATLLYDDRTISVLRPHPPLVIIILCCVKRRRIQLLPYDMLCHANGATIFELRMRHESPG
jgi:hypothetical protein